MDEALHDTLLAQVVSTADALHPELATLAARYRLIPLYLDWMGFIGLRTDGELLFVGWDPPHDPEIVREAYFRRVGLVAGAERYPSLAFLLPERPANALSCETCGGTGCLRCMGSECWTISAACAVGSDGSCPARQRRYRDHDAERALLLSKERR